MVVELQETVLVSDIEGEGMTVHGFAPEELVIQDAIEDVVAEYVQCTEDDGLESAIAVETCEMSPDGVALEDEGLQMDDKADQEDGCGDYLMISCRRNTLSLFSHSVFFTAIPCGLKTITIIIMTKTRTLYISPFVCSNYSAGLIDTS